MQQEFTKEINKAEILVEALGYMQKYDNEIEKIVLCGTPTKNKFTVFAIAIAYLFKFIGFGKKTNKILNTLTFKAYNKNYKLGKRKNRSADAKKPIL